MTQTGEHRDGGACWCQPVIDYEDPASGARLYVHRRTADGPVYVKSHHPLCNGTHTEIGQCIGVPDPAPTEG